MQLASISCILIRSWCYNYFTIVFLLICLSVGQIQEYSALVRFENFRKIVRGSNPDRIYYVRGISEIRLYVSLQCVMTVLLLQEI